VRVLLTGAFGNVGRSALSELLAQGHRVRCFDLETRANRRTARGLDGEVEIVWGDLRDGEAVSTAVQDQEVVIHLAFIIPSLSATGVESEAHPDWARQVNVGGTRNLIRAMEALPHPPRIIFTSSCHVYGRTQDQPPPRTASDPVRPIEHYSRHKVACERMIESSGLEWTILRLAATLPIAIKLDRAMFDVPLHNRMEYVHTRDVGLALANALHCPQVWGRIWLIGGGPGCQHRYGEIVEQVLEAMGVGMLPEEAFGTAPFATDWLDTAESQRLLQYQTRDLDDYVRDMRSALGLRRHLVSLFRPVARRLVLRRSPYYRGNALGVGTRGNLRLADWFSRLQLKMRSPD